MDLILLLVLWSLLLFFYPAHLIRSHYIFLICFPTVTQLILFSILGNYDEHLGALVMSRRRLIINGMIGFFLTFFIYKFFTLTLYDIFHIRVRHYLLIFFPIQVTLYALIMIFSLKVSKLRRARRVCVLAGKHEFERLKHWFLDNQVLENEIEIQTVLDTNDGSLLTVASGEVVPVTKETKLFEILKQHDLVIYFTTQILDTREARNLLRFGSESGSFFDFATFCGLYRETYPVDAIDTEWYVRKSTNLWLKIALYLRFRRFFDFIASIILFIITIPLWIFAMVGILITSPGPIFYTQERIGRMGNKFKIIKFRTMRTDAEKSGPQLATTGDSRVTGIGKILRRTRIDELPQIINVLKGEMSLIGPRPEREHFESLLNKDLPLLQLRNFIAPGITGLAQVNSNYANDVKSYKKKLGYDLFYILNISPLLDLSILLRTIRTVLFKKGS